MRYWRILDYRNYKVREKIIDKFVEECSENIYENETLNIIPLIVYEKVCDSCVLYIVLFVVFSITRTCTCRVFIYFHCYLKKDIIDTTFNVAYLNIQITTKQIDIKNRTDNFYNDSINIKSSDPNVL